MTLKINFLKTDFKTLNISKFRFLSGIIVGFSYSFTLYSFFYMSREAFRILSSSFNYDIWILNDNEVQFYNLFFAFISVIFGQAICFSFWFGRPKKPFGLVKQRTSSIINDQSSLMWVFLSWFSKLAVVFGIMFGLTFHGGYYVFSFYPTYNYVFVLIIIVLYFHSWITIRRIHKNKSLKYLLVSMIVVSVTSFGLSHIQLIDYKAINEGYFNQNAIYKYKLELPESDYSTSLEKKSLIEDFYIVSDLKSENANPKIIYENEEILISNLTNKINEIKEWVPEYDVPFITIRVSAHKNTKMGIIKHFKDELEKAGINRIAYGVIPKNREYDKMYYKDLSFLMRIPNKQLIEMYPHSFKNEIYIKLITEKQFKVNDTIVETEKLNQSIKNLVTQENDYIFNLHIDSQQDIQGFIKTISALKVVIDDLRNDFSMRRYNKTFDNISSDKQNEISKIFAFRVREYYDN